MMTSNASPTTGRLTELSGSPWDEELLTHFTQHVNAEQELLEAYAEFREGGPEHVRYLVDLILGDEARHHRMFQELVNRVRSDIDFRDYNPKVPYLRPASAGVAALTEATDRLLAFEHEDQKSLHRLQKELRPVRDTTLFSLLVELMELDTKKHIAILEFLRRSARSHLW
jgi:hypothetical protein